MLLTAVKSHALLSADSVDWCARISQMDQESGEDMRRSYFSPSISLFRYLYMLESSEDDQEAQQRCYLLSPGLIMLPKFYLLTQHCRSTQATQHLIELKVYTDCCICTLSLSCTQLNTLVPSRLMLPTSQPSEWNNCLKMSPVYQCWCCFCH